MLLPVLRKLLSACLAAIAIAASACENAEVTTPAAKAPVAAPTGDAIERIRNESKVIHVLVALCDNENQGIVPVSARLGNGQDPSTNLYWGAAYGVKTFFSKSRMWEKFLEVQAPRPNVLSRIVLKHRGDDAILVADAYDGSRMKETIDDFFAAASGNKLENIEIGGKTFQIFAGASLIAFVGHDGLMDFRYDKPIVRKDNDARDAVILACASKNYFSKPLKQTGAKPLLWTTNLVAPEAYILHDALEGWLSGEADEQVRRRAVTAYSKYQRIGTSSANSLFATGW